SSWPSTRTPMVFTPDGRLIFEAIRAGESRLFMRSLDRPVAVPLAGTENALVPFVAADGKWIGFWTANELRKVSIDGGAATSLCPLTAIGGPFGAVWSRADVILFGDYSSG